MLEIYKKGNKNFQHESEGFEPYGANDLTIIFDGNTVKLRSFKGKIVLERFGYDVSQVRVYDVGGAVETFSNVVSLKQRLINLGYPFAGSTVDVISLTEVEWANITGLPETSSSLVSYVASVLEPLEDDIEAIESELDIIDTQIDDINDELDLKLEDAPIDGSTYGRKDGAWEEITEEGLVESVTGQSVDNTDPLNPIVNSIPREGTDGNPVTGTIEFDNTNDDITFKGIVNSERIHFRDDGNIEIQTGGGSNFVYIDGVSISQTNGINHDEYIAPLTDKSYTQKKYVDDNFEPIQETFTVSTLPAGTTGQRAIVTDAVSPTYLGTLTGGGAVTCPVWHNGTNWVSN